MPPGGSGERLPPGRKAIRPWERSAPWGLPDAAGAAAGGSAFGGSAFGGGAAGGGCRRAGRRRHVLSSTERTGDRAATAAAHYRTSPSGDRRATAGTGSPTRVAAGRAAATVATARATGPMVAAVTAPSGITTAAGNIGDCATAIPAATATAAAAAVAATAARRRTTPPPPGMCLRGTQRQPKNCHARHEHLLQTCATHFHSPLCLARNWTVILLHNVINIPPESRKSSRLGKLCGLRRAGCWTDACRYSGPKSF